MGNVNPRVDLAFKKIFGVEENKDLLISLINSIVSPDDQVADITLMNPYNPKNFREDKLSVLDIKAKGHDGKRFNIEIQITDEADYKKRALYYWAKLYTEQLREKDTYGQLSKAIGIHILNFTSIPESKKYHNVFHITEKDDGIVYFKDLELHTIELKKFLNDGSVTGQEQELQKGISALIGKVKTSLDLWLAFLTRNDLLNKDNLPEELQDTHLKKALGVLEVMNFNDEEREAYEDHLKWLRIETNTILNYEQKGMEKGLLKGMEAGLEKGKAEGLTEGKREVAIEMLGENFSDEMIIKLSKITPDKLAALKLSLKK
jgi:predicted transposase/invertase (TIGR01784 family)